MLDFRVFSFLSVCKHLSYTKAAQELNLTQPAITQHIQYLQTHYQVKFFIRENNQLQLTPEGELFRNAMITFRQSEHKLEEDLVNLSLNRFNVRFGSVFAIAEEDLPEHLSAYVKHYPKRNIQMTVDDTEHLLRELDSGNIHFAIVEDIGFDKSGYDILPWTTGDFICCCSSERQIPEGPLYLKDLFHEPLIIHSSELKKDNMVLKSLHDHNVYLSCFNHIFEVGNVSVIRQMLLKNTGICFLSKKIVESELKNGLVKQIPLEDYQASHRFLFIWRKGSIHEHLFRKMYTILKTGDVYIKFDD